MKTKVLKSERITIERAEANFDRACDAAHSLAKSLCGIDDDGHSPIPLWERSCTDLIIDFLTYTRGNADGHTYGFRFRVVRYWDEDDDEDVLEREDGTYLCVGCGGPELAKQAQEQGWTLWGEERGEWCEWRGTCPQSLYYIRQNED